ncbi:sel1 repeat family protein [Aquipseudomonas campi]|uniref:sel1 repeat family protein n=1 Tax=Aquipseudomonas campi TaxID=2731681 RepID=UPI001EFF0782|nr:sel1 repeat family protein [Pseudomonas campi]
MKRTGAALLTLLALLAGIYTFTAYNEDSISDSLPKLTLQQVLPATSSNEHCNNQMDSDILYGIGLRLFENGDYAPAESCLIMAAPNHNRAFCYLSIISEQAESKSTQERNRDSFNYLAYSAARNDWCAEYGIYQTYLYGTKGVPQDKDLALLWLERSALHGYPESQTILVDHYESQNDLAASYAWSKIIATDQVDALRARMTPEQLAEGEEHYTELSSTVTSKEAMYAEAREEDVGRYSAVIQMDYPDIFNGMTSEQRYSFVKQAMLTAIEQPYIQRRSQVTSYIVIARRAQIEKPGVNILQNKNITALLQTDDLTVEEVIEQAQDIINSTYM